MTTETMEIKLRYGLAGIMSLVGCSRPTAQRIKNSGILDDAIIQIGNKIIIDERRALECLKKHSKV